VPADGTYLARTSTYLLSDCDAGASHESRVEAYSALSLRGERATLHISVEAVEQGASGCPRPGQRSRYFRARFAGSLRIEGPARRLDFDQLELSQRPSPDYPYGDAIASPVRRTLHCSLRTVEAYPADDEDMTSVNENDPVVALRAVACRADPAPLPDVDFAEWLVDGVLLLAEEPGVDWRRARLPPVAASEGLRIGSESCVHEQMRRRSVW
jgi:hypothetical protein